jgi:hypothetical protein
MVVGFATNYAISAYPNYSCQLKSRSRKVFSIQPLQGTCDKSVGDMLGFHDLFDYYCVFAFECLYLK